MAGSRYMHPALLADLQSNCASLSLLMRVIPKGGDFADYGVTDNNATLPYDDGSGVLDYSAPVGLDLSEIHASASLSVDNSEAQSLMPLPVYDIPVSEESIIAGYYDYAEVRIYLVNFLKLEPGRHCELFRGSIGQISVRDDGTSVVPELRGLAAQLKQEVCTKYTKTCRAIDGTQPVGSPLPGLQVKRDPCGIDFTTYNKTSTVSAVALENTLTFRIDPADIDGDWGEVNFFAPGRVKITAGRNAGQTREVLSSTVDGWITCRHEFGFPMEEGDEVEYRRGCSFIARDEAKGCIAHAGPDWIHHFKGYPDIPTENEKQLLTPGATVGPGDGGGTSVPFSGAIE